MKDFSDTPRYNLKMYFIVYTIIEITLRAVLCIFVSWQTMRCQPICVRYGTRMADHSEELSGRAAVASYVATLSNDLASMARRTGLDTLGYLLEMVRLEAESVARHNGVNGRRS